ncbi:MAG: CHASE3 domain-containing protein [Mucilaginibacter sp.]|uniref:CHASE3 domain-containing protein n=1 Tax=Mucilaginibacter sp. TaxID=1882438 RepID=UPI0031A856A4
MKISFDRNLKIGYGFSFIALLGVSFISYMGTRQMLKSSRLVEHSNVIVRKLDSLISVMKDAETGQRGYLITGRTEFLEPYYQSPVKAHALIGSLQKLTSNDNRQQANILNLQQMVSTRMEAFTRNMELKKLGKNPDLNNMLAGKKAMDNLRKTVATAELHEQQLLNAELIQYRSYVRYVPYFILASVLIALVVTALSYKGVTAIIRDRADMQVQITNKERETAELNDELAASNEEMTAINEELNVSNEELLDSRQQLTNLNAELEQIVVSRTAELALSEERFRMILQTLPTIAWTNSPTGEVDFFNRQWFNYTGLDFEFSKGSGWQSVIHPEDVGYNHSRFNEIIASGEAGEFEIRERRHDGIYRCHLIRMAPLKRDNGQIQLWVGTATDIEELKQLERQKDDFINIASHELKTPLTSLKSTIQIIESMSDKLSPEKMNALIERASRSVNKVSVLVEDLLYMGKLSRGQLDLKIVQTDLAGVIRESCAYFNAVSNVEFVIEAEAHVSVPADAERISQVIINFINNALKYASSSKKIYIHLSVNEMAIISVRDEGPGISLEHQPFLFDRYYRSPDGKQASGMGIGLYISAEIIKRHGGQIGVISKPGEGSTFWFSVPMVQTSGHHLVEHQEHIS